MAEKFSVFSLFSGAGGLDLGFKLSGQYDILFANDILESATRTYSKNFNVRHVTSTPETSDLPLVYRGNVANLKVSNFDKLNPDVLVGGPPCQDFSIVRGPKKERKGIEVTRGQLYSHFVRVLIHLQPKVFLFENVPGLKSANEGEAYKVILNDFSNLKSQWNKIKKLVGNTSMAIPKDYEIIFQGIVNASHLGVPQARRRLIVVGLRKDIAGSMWWKIKSVKRRFASLVKNKSSLLGRYPLASLEVFEGKALPELQSRYLEIMESFRDVVKEVDTDKAIKWKEKVWNKLSFDIVSDYFLANRITEINEEEIDVAFKEHKELLKELNYTRPVVSLSPPDKSNRTANESENVLERMKRIPPNENHEFVRGTDWEVEGKGMSLIYRRLHPLKPSYTIVAHGGGGTWGYHYEKRRSRLTSRERARLQTFPDDFIFQGNVSEVRAQIGEAVPPLMGKRLAEAIRFVLKEME